MANNNQLDDWQDIEETRSPDAVAITKELTPTAQPVGDTFVQNLARGATIGFGDELGGHIEALGSKIGLRGLGSPYLRDVRLETPEEDVQSYEDVYTQARDYRRSELEKGEKQNPIAAFTGQMLGGIATIPAGGALLKGASTLPAVGKAVQAGTEALTSGSKLAQLAKVGAAEGSLYGLGESEAETPEGMLWDTVKGGATGGITSGLFGKGLEAGGKAVKWVGKELSELKPTQKAVEVISNLFFDLPPKYTEELIKNKNLNEVRTKDQINDLLEEVGTKLRDDLSEADDKAWSFLSPVKQIPANDLQNLVFENLKKFRIDTKLGSDKEALSKANEILDTLAEKMILSDQDIKTIVQKLDREIDWKNAGRDTANDLLRSIRADFDSKIKGNLDYQKQMDEFVAPLTKSYLNLKNKFGLKSAAKVEMIDPDKTSKFIERLYDAQGNPKMPDFSESLSKISPELVQDIRLRKILDRTEGGITQGSRNTLGGTVIGGGVGGVPGMMAGAVAGYVKDKYGRKIGKELIDRNRDKIINRDILFQKLGERVGRGAQKGIEAIPAVTRGINAAMVPNFVANELGKDPGKFTESDKRTVTKIYLMKKNNPNMSDDEIRQVMQKSIPGYQQKAAADEFLKD